MTQPAINLLLGLSVVPSVLSAAGAQKSHKAAGKGDARPNILYIMSDDHAVQAISAYSNRLCRTPNIDRIAAAGVRFDNSFVCNSLSGPARAVVMTGKFSHMNGFMDNKPTTLFNGEQPTLPNMLHAAGYQTAIVGKWHLGSTPVGFDYYCIHVGQGSYYNPDFIEPSGMRVYQGYATDLTGDKALEWLRERDGNRPFLLMTHFKAPHRPWLPAPEKMDMYEETTFPLPETFYDDYAGRGIAALQQKMTIAKDMIIGSDNKMSDDGPEYRRMSATQKAAFDKSYKPIRQDFEARRLSGNDLSEWKYQRYMRDYLKCISSVDDNVGRLIDYLQQNGLWENTIVVYTSDQGFYLGEHGWFDKRFMYEESLRSPLLMSYPNGIKKGMSTTGAMVQQIDYAPTFLDYAGVAPDPGMQGVSIRGILEGREKSVRDAVYYHYYEFPGPHSVKRHYGVRTDRYKLIHFYNDIDQWEMYDLQSDPHEMKSIYDDPAFADVRKKMTARLKELEIKYKDTNPTEKQ